MKIPVLTYHSGNVEGNAYQNNDHIALMQDLRLINEMGFEVISAHWLVDWLRGQRELQSQKRYLVITFDDGLDMDYFDWDHPAHGPQRGFRQIMQDFVHAIPTDSQPHLHATTFVIASPEARAEIEQVSLAGNQIMGDHWWMAAHQDPMFSVESHSWDHNHDDLKQSLCETSSLGRFDVVDQFDSCDLEIRQASDYINQCLAPGKTTLLAYPWGQYSQYIAKEYLPDNIATHGLVGAFTCGGEYVAVDTDRWIIPRFVCGDDWKSPGELYDILLAACEQVQRD